MVGQRKKLTSAVAAAEASANSASANPPGSSGSFQSSSQADTKSLCLDQQVISYGPLSRKVHDFDEMFPCDREQFLVRDAPLEPSATNTSGSGGN